MSLASLGKGPAVAELKKRLEQVARVKAPLLLVGERGAGAELCAHFLHQPNTPWLAPDGFGQLVESPLVLLEQARDGVLYLEGVDGLSKLEQKGLLLLFGKLEKFNVRLVCSASQSLAALTDQGAFDCGLFQALSGLILAVPALREHREDIPDVAKLMLAQLVETKESPARHFTTGALNALRQENWPGNLSQLHNVVKTLAQTALGEEIGDQEVNRVLAQFNPIQSAEGPDSSFPVPFDRPLREARDEFERAYFEHHLKKSAGNMSRVAEAVGLERTHLYRKLKQLGITPDGQKGTAKTRGESGS
jgi:DNA-binding NtrC family response regulator